MAKKYVFSSESVAEGHPDKVSDYISDSVLDACLAQDPSSRVACETLVKSNQVVLAGEISTKAKLNYEEIVRQAIREIGYVNDDDIFHADKVFITNNLTSQSQDIAQGVDAKRAKDKDTAEQGAGDQGIMFGYASNETRELMPAALMYAHRIGRKIAKIRHAGRQAKWLRPDCKSQVSIRYEGDKAIEITAVVISTQHTEDVRRKDIEKFMIEKVIKNCLPKNMLTKNTHYLINPTGRFVIGGPQGDAGLTGRKIIVDTYGGSGRHGGGAFSGKDPTKVDRSAAYASRYLAKNIVASGISEKCLIQLAYAIGVSKPLSIFIKLANGDEAKVDKVKKIIEENFNLSPRGIREMLKLNNP
ncbi:MAG TPA: methionine adenosyltransferase, partial [Opitutae bacterium]|nr:methionine adenosyltransferase [Opitutae bacterium]